MAQRLLGSGSTEEQGGSSVTLMAKESTMYAGTETAEKVLPHYSPCVVCTVSAEQEENSLCRPGRKSQR